MDLISRKAAIDALNMNGCCGMGIQYLLDCDSVHAVPLDKLCYWLADNAVLFASDNDSDPEAWKETIKEQVMEEHNGTDNP